MGCATGVAQGRALLETRTALNLVNVREIEGSALSSVDMMMHMAA